MKKFTKNFIMIMLAGMLIITMLANDFLRSDRLLPVFALDESQDINEDVRVSVEMLSPDEVDIDRIFDFGKKENSYDEFDSTSSYDEFDDMVTTVTTGLTTKGTSTTKSTATGTYTTKRTTTVPQNENDVNAIKNPNYKSKYYIVVYTGSQSVVVYGKDSTGAYNKQVKVFTCSTGNKSSTPTRKGVYTIHTKYRWHLLMGGVYGQYCSAIGSGYLFHSVPYASQNPSTLYDASYNNLGKAVSHGCIRLCVRDCKWIYDNAPIGTQVNVVWTSGPAGPGVPKRKSGAKYSGWDPSDKWADGNPYFENIENTTTKKTTSTKKTTTSSKATTSATESSKTTSSSKTSRSSRTTTTTTTVTTTTASQVTSRTHLWDRTTTLTTEARSYEVS